MRCPRKLYLVVSRKSKHSLPDAFGEARDVYVKRSDAQYEADEMNADSSGTGDWRVETFVKGD